LLLIPLNFLKQDFSAVSVQNHFLHEEPRGGFCDTVRNSDCVIELHHAEPTEMATSMLWVSYVLERCRHPAAFWAASKEFFPFLEFVTIET
jgi:hypothetical protein